jgi:hypothetical protein
MADRNAPPESLESERPTARGAAAVQGTHQVPADYGMSGSKGMQSPIIPLLWLLIPFFGCVAYGIFTR